MNLESLDRPAKAEAVPVLSGCVIMAATNDAVGDAEAEMITSNWTAVPLSAERSVDGVNLSPSCASSNCEAGIAHSECEGHQCGGNVGQGVRGTSVWRNVGGGVSETHKRPPRTVRTAYVLV